MRLITPLSLFCWYSFCVLEVSSFSERVGYAHQAVRNVENIIEIVEVKQKGGHSLFVTKNIYSVFLELRKLWEFKCNLMITSACGL